MKNERIFLDKDKGYLIYWDESEHTEVRVYVSGNTLIKLLNALTEENKLTKSTLPISGQ